MAKFFNIKPKDAGSDIEAFEWENVPEESYAGTQTPAVNNSETDSASGTSIPSADDIIAERIRTDSATFEHTSVPSVPNSEHSPTGDATTLPPATMSLRKPVPPAPAK